jgi:hypothetical protein
VITEPSKDESGLEPHAVDPCVRQVRVEIHADLTSDDGLPDIP